MTKIALISFGHVDVVLPLIKNLKSKGVDVELYLCFAFNRKSESILDFTGKKITTGFLSNAKKEELLPDKIKQYLTDISIINFFIFYNLKLRSFRNIKLSFSLAKRLKSYDIIHFSGTNGVLPLLIGLLRKKPLIFTIHDIHSHSGEKTRFNFAEKMNEFLLKSKYQVIVQNLSDYNFLIQKHPEITRKLKFIPFGILDIYREFKSDLKEVPESDLLFFGRISPYKGIEYLIEAIMNLHLKGIRIKTIVAGEGTVYFKSENINKLGIELINRYISNEELVALIKNTKIVICPYTDSTQSGVIMTAFAFNKPVIATAVGSFKEVIEEGITGMLVPPKDSDTLAAKIEYLISHPVYLDQISTNIKNISVSGNYSWPHIAEKMQALYLSLHTGTSD